VILTVKHPSKNVPHSQPYRVSAALCPLDVGYVPDDTAKTAVNRARGSQASHPSMHNSAPPTGVRDGLTPRQLIGLSKQLDATSGVLVRHSSRGNRFQQDDLNSMTLSPSRRKRRSGSFITVAAFDLWRLLVAENTPDLSYRGPSTSGPCSVSKSETPLIPCETNDVQSFHGFSFPYKIPTSPPRRLAGTRFALQSARWLRWLPPLAVAASSA